MDPQYYYTTQGAIPAVMPMHPMSMGMMAPPMSMMPQPVYSPPRGRHRSRSPPPRRTRSPPPRRLRSPSPRGSRSPSPRGRLSNLRTPQIWPKERSHSKSHERDGPRAPSAMTRMRNKYNNLAPSSKKKLLVGFLILIFIIMLTLSILFSATSAETLSNHGIDRNIALWVCWSITSFGIMLLVGWGASRMYGGRIKMGMAAMKGYGKARGKLPMKRFARR